MRLIQKSESGKGLGSIGKADINVSMLSLPLYILFNLYVVSGHTPESCDYNRTTLIAKGHKDQADPNNYNMQCIHQSVLGSGGPETAQTSNTSGKPERGVPANGCYNTIQSLNIVTNHSKAHSRATVAQLDIRKAFDSVPNETIRRALQIQGVCSKYYNNESIQNSQEKPSLKNTECSINGNCGVTQGYPRSPQLFNLFLEPLIATFERRSGYTVGEENLILLASTSGGAQTLLKITMQYLGARGISIAPNKCEAFEITGMNKRFTIIDPQLR